MNTPDEILGMIAAEAIERDPRDIRPRRLQWFFDDPLAVDRLHVAAGELLGTPFVRYSRAVGPRGGIDCVGGCEFLQARSGVIAPDEFEFARGADDYQGHGTSRKIIRYLLGDHPDPQSARLARIFSKVALFRELRQLAQHKTNLDESLFMAGDILVLRHADLFHLPVMLGPRTFISVVPRLGAIEGDIHDPDYSTHLVALFRARGAVPARSVWPDGRITPEAALS